MGTQTAEASMHEALLQSYFAAGTCASGSHDLSSLQLLHLLRCSLILSDPSHFVCENEGEDRERDWERSAHSCHQLRKHVDALRLNCMRTVISDEESMSVIAQCSSSAGIDAEEQAPMLYDDITAWSEFKTMRDMIQLTESQIPEYYMQVRINPRPALNAAASNRADENQGGKGRRKIPGEISSDWAGGAGEGVDTGGGRRAVDGERGKGLGSTREGGNEWREEILDGWDGKGQRNGREECKSGGGQWKRQRVLDIDDMQVSSSHIQAASSALHSSIASTRVSRPHGFDYEDTIPESGRGVAGSAGWGFSGSCEVQRGSGGGGGGKNGWGRDEHEMGEGSSGMVKEGRLEREDGGREGMARGGGAGGGGGGSVLRNDFVSGTDKLRRDIAEKNGGRGGSGRDGHARGGGGRGACNDWQEGSQYSAAAGGKTLGGRRAAAPPSAGFKCPWKKKEDQEQEAAGRGGGGVGGKGGSVNKIVKRLGGGAGAAAADGAEEEELKDPRYKNIDPKMIEMIENEIVDNSPGITWDDIAGLEFAKSSVQEIVVWPMLRPDLFTGLRGPPKGLLLFGPPGTGKTLIGKTIATESNATFFSISASSLMSKWVGEGERMVRALFAVARVQSPSVIFIDEIDSLLSQRGGEEGEASRRVKTEFLVQMDGVGGSAEERMLLVGATNRPQELDEAARRRLVKRLYIPLPDLAARVELMTRLLRKEEHALSSQQIHDIAHEAAGYSGADVKSLCAEASLGPIREIRDIRKVSAAGVRPISFQDFKNALRQVRASVGSQDIAAYIEWNKQYGSFPVEEDAS